MRVRACSCACPTFPPGTKSLLSKFLTPEIFEQLKDKVTPGGITFADVIRSGVDNVDSGIGLYSGDEDVYTVFAPIMDQVIESYHRFPPVRVLMLLCYWYVVMMAVCAWRSLACT